MKTTLEVAEDGRIFVVKDCPKKPEGRDLYPDSILAAVARYKKALASCERILCEDQEQAMGIIFMNHTNCKILRGCLVVGIKPGLYQVDCEWEEDDSHNPEKCRYGYGGGYAADMMAYNGKVAILKESPQKESQ